MSANAETILFQIVTKLKQQSNQDDNRTTYATNTSTIFNLTKSLETVTLTLSEFTSFVTDTHDILIKGDSSKRCSILRAIRYGLSHRDFVTVLIDRQMHWCIGASLEKDGDCAVERMQALKLMEKVQQIASDIYPLSFARSLVAVANFKDDSFRKVCIDNLRELAITNPLLVSQVDGFGPLMDAVLEPITQSLADSIVLTIIHLINDPVTR
jgi:hypothetical protein